MKTVENTNQTHPWSTAPICKYWNNVELKLGRNTCSHLDNLEYWSHKWDMEFNPSKCQVIHLTM